MCDRQACATPNHNHATYQQQSRFIPPSIMEMQNDERKIILALQAIEQDPNLTIRAAAKIYSVNHATLARRKHGQISRRDWQPKSRKLTDLEEEIIVEYVLDLDSRAFPSRIQKVEDMANRLLEDRNATPVGKRWASNFVKRQPQLQTRFFRRYDYKRAQCEDPEIIRGWFALVRNTISSTVSLMTIFTISSRPAL